MTARETPESQTGPGQVNSKLKGRIDEINTIYTASVGSILIDKDFRLKMLKTGRPARRPGQNILKTKVHFRTL